jgi:hypothetical protein
MDGIHFGVETAHIDGQIADHREITQRFNGNRTAVGGNAANGGNAG